MVQTVAVIGAGAAGLTAVKCCLDEGLQPTCFEMSDDIGGLWKYKEESQEGRTTVMKTTVANVSKEIGAYSDFPPPVEHPIYMHHTHLEEYLCLYADKFALREHIYLNHKVIQISETDDHEVSGQWFVKVNDVRNGMERTETFDAVLLCTGVFARPVIPDFPGLHKFQGKIIHTREYKTSNGFEGNNTLVVGVGNSAVDAAIDISDVAKQVYISSRNGTWVLGRLGRYGKPVDMTLMTRVGFYVLKMIPSMINKVVRKKCNNKIDHNLYGINPRADPINTTGTLNDLLPYYLLIGSIKMKLDIKEIHERSVEFVDGTKIDNIDAIVFGTGYMPDFPFLKPDVIGEDKSNMYLIMFPPERKIQTLAAIGCFRQKGPAIPVMEMQSRFATRVFKGLVKLPDKNFMWNSIRQNQEQSMKTRCRSVKGITQFDYLPYMDELAGSIGCKPNLLKLMFQDRKLAKECVFGPLTPYQYRLTGPHAWSGARDAVLNQWDRVYRAINDNPRSIVIKQEGSVLKSLFLLVITLAVLLYALFWR